VRLTARTMLIYLLALLAYPIATVIGIPPKAVLFLAIVIPIGLTLIVGGVWVFGKAFAQGPESLETSYHGPPIWGGGTWQETEEPDGTEET